MKKHSVVIRMGAAHWDATIITPNGTAHFDFRRMTRDQKREWYGKFMGSVRRMMRADAPLNAPRKPRRHRRQKKVAR